MAGLSETRGPAIAAARPRVVAALAAQFRDLDLAEEAFSAACEKALAHDGEIADLAGWLYVTGKRVALNRMRSRAAEARAIAGKATLEPMADILHLPDPIPDERLRLLFVCCHPALALEARVGLALKVVCGVEVAAIASGFLVAEPAMYQRITRAKAKIRQANIPFESPPRRLWPERVQAILATLELAFTLAYGDAAGAGPHAGFGEEVERLADMLAELLPDDPEVPGFAALVKLARSREAARIDAGGAMVPLSMQDPASWDAGRIDAARILLDRAASARRPGPHQVLALVHFTHAKRIFGGEVDWTTIARLYETLATMRGGAPVAVASAVARSLAGTPGAGLDALDGIDPGTAATYLPYHAARADMLRRAGRVEEAAVSYRAALALQPSPAERKFLEERLASLC
ncbi:DUF6596 domain-containing protein [Alteriqipengyuania sp. WL0013]|uniref:RNA polymerase sigma factor n=1 Tax=Alteriqipengyuania sp. WL0013 TaxID=3110773 RepID=UPI002C3B13C7|nr:DUF6596 domain-containing protein [Alteriqipengyuania sp. WL0013]MEB3414769.1 DUF6596 domain-containing protein [Alteriqipengyuania sp. WL0013]